MIESARSFTSRSWRLSEVSFKVRIGASAGFTRLYTGGYGRLPGKVPLAWLIAACTSCAAMSMSRSIENCRMIVDSPADESELIMVSPERSEEHTSELQSLMRNSYAVFCLKKKQNTQTN